MPVGLALEKGPERFTYREYRTWDEDDRWELIEGVAYAMSPAPRPRHQAVLAALFRQFDRFLEGKPCRPWLSPVNVFFPLDPTQDEDEVDTIVQPDLFVVCDPTKVRSDGIWGPPTLVVEILSPSTTRKDLNEKFALYQRAGVKEYWVVDPVGRWVHQYVLGPEGRYGPQNLLLEKGTIVSPTLPGLEVELTGLWSDL